MLIINEKIENLIRKSMKLKKKVILKKEKSRNYLKRKNANFTTAKYKNENFKFT